ncbi:uncharacterized protein SOCE26_078210 [Sorangium cellulosum]|uniref:Uncharacterized protein n=1 Tax=Sorangium cellulosum TaxID=56 RepID=A0A2L0F444_SORCE|nr:hypothetical protein [Sorangium cellulosum]AUX46316.1 uncharacterized protein SOCE26_078210 [Sorangium cellulosum]
MKITHCVLLSMAVSLVACGPQEEVVEGASAPITLSATTLTGESFAVEFHEEHRGLQENSWRAVARGETYHVESATMNDGGSIEVRDGADRWLNLTWTDDGHMSLTRFDGLTSYTNSGQLVAPEAVVSEQAVMLALIEPGMMKKLLGERSAATAEDDTLGESQQALWRIGVITVCPGAACSEGSYTCCCKVGDRCVTGNNGCWCEPATRTQG